MPDITLNQAAARIGITRDQLDKLILNGRELSRRRVGRGYVVDSNDVDMWMQRKAERTVLLDRADFVTAFTFAMKINYRGHSRTDFGTTRQRSRTQAVENWTQGALAEIALRKFVEQRFHVRLELEFRVFDDQIVGQDIVSVVREHVSNPPRVRVSVKSGKQNGMFLIVSPREVENDQRRSDVYVYVRVLFQDDFILRLFREHPDMDPVRDMIPLFEQFHAEIVGYCRSGELEQVDRLDEAGITGPRYIKRSGELNQDHEAWQRFVEAL